MDTRKEVIELVDKTLGFKKVGLKAIAAFKKGEVEVIEIAAPPESGIFQVIDTAKDPKEWDFPRPVTSMDEFKNRLLLAGVDVPDELLIDDLKGLKITLNGGEKTEKAAK